MYFINAYLLSYLLSFPPPPRHPSQGGADEETVCQYLLRFKVSLLLACTGQYRTTLPLLPPLTLP